MAPNEDEVLQTSQSRNSFSSPSPQDICEIGPVHIDCPFKCKQCLGCGIVIQRGAWISLDEAHSSNAASQHRTDWRGNFFLLMSFFPPSLIFLHIYMSRDVKKAQVSPESFSREFQHVHWSAVSLASGGTSEQRRARETEGRHSVWRTRRKLNSRGIVLLS